MHRWMWLHARVSVPLLRAWPILYCTNAKIISKTCLCRRSMSMHNHRDTRRNIRLGINKDSSCANSSLTFLCDDFISPVFAAVSRLPARTAWESFEVFNSWSNGPRHGCVLLHGLVLFVDIPFTLLRYRNHWVSPAHSCSLCSDTWLAPTVHISGYIWSNLQPMGHLVIPISNLW